MSDNYPVDKAIERLEERVYREEKTRYSQHQSLENRIKTLEERLPKIEALEQAHAELAAKVESVHDQVRDVRHNYHELEYRVDKLESPAPAPDPVCQFCGHPQSEHDGGGCMRVKPEFCMCMSFIVPAAEPEPAPLDPVLVRPSHEWAMVIRWVNESKSSDRIDYCLQCGIIRKSYFHASGEAVSPTYFGIDIPRGTVDTPACLSRAYGRDGAR